ncbi:hypothetical protein Y11_39671 [Yersinia enterocolitica subsp. palearctica Y11]|uniref:Uncharacterized protein n=1 Tax=Yersinia enterocolitica subsp. palearctica serotype O:3 (strain DSM 13030 / CIP 106945 / Y11) TaxID=930944 RepID=A0A0H3NU98_YERE1|nr:hypothetical protein Y11_39671 [Yersinia enterocolitica subsp. palearctica Y11]
MATLTLALALVITMLLILKDWQRLSNDWAYFAYSLRDVPQTQEKGFF